VIAAVIARGKFLPIDARDLVLFGMHWIVNHAIDARYRAFFTRFEYLPPTGLEYLSAT
jgi:hypothetical protein